MKFLSENTTIKNIISILVVFFVIIFAYLYQFKHLKITKQTEIVVEKVASTTPKEEIPETKDLLGRSELSYAGGTEGRRKNIELGIAEINGTIIQPGEEFSFKKTIGTTTIEEGYSMERIFLNGEVSKGIGGGLCQVSTLVFRAAMDSALQITERQGHSYTVSYYDYGLDATYSDPGPDLKFVNDTEHPILIKGKTENLNAIFEIYGTSDGRVASTSEVLISNLKDVPPTKYVYVTERESDEPKCINTPQIGYTAKVKYEVLFPDGKKKEKEFVSRYKPLQRVCYVVGDEILNFDIKKMY